MKKVLTILCTVASIGGAALFCVCFIGRRLKSKKRDFHSGWMPRSVTDHDKNPGGRP